MNRVMGMTLCAAALAAACSGDVYGPVDATIEFRLAETAEGGSASTSESIFAFVDGVHNFMDMFVYRVVDGEEAAKEPVQTTIRGGSNLQPLPGILVEVTIHYMLIEDCTSNPLVLSETNYFELVQIGVKKTSKGCSPPLTPAEQIGDLRPNDCLLYDGPEDNGKSILVRTGPYGTVQFDVIPRLSDPIQGAVFEIQARSGGGAAGFSLPDDVGEVCFAAASTAAPSGGTTAAPRTGPYFFAKPHLR